MSPSRRAGRPLEAGRRSATRVFCLLNGTDLMCAVLLVHGTADDVVPHDHSTTCGPELADLVDDFLAR